MEILRLLISGDFTSTGAAGVGFYPGTGCYPSVSSFSNTDHNLTSAQTLIQTSPGSPGVTSDQYPVPAPHTIKTENDNIDEEEDTTEDDDDKEDILKEGCKDNGSKPPFSYVAMISK